MTKSAQYTQLDIELEPQSAKDKPRWRLPEGWRFTVWTGTLITFLVLWANIGLLVWAQTKAHDIGESGVVALYEGTCLERDNIFRWSHIAINIFSTLLLGASSFAMQCLCAPDREDIDRLHARGVWMDVGISSLRNLRWIARRRLFLWICLCLSSVPLHLV